MLGSAGYCRRPDAGAKKDYGAMDYITLGVFAQ
jgi:hypothetical protein